MVAKYCAALCLAYLIESSLLVTAGCNSTTEFMNSSSSNVDQSAFPACNVSHFALGTRKCPGNCSFSEPDPEVGCYFYCVTGDDCGNRNKRTHVPDFDQQICRGCKAVGCRTCAPHTDLCILCYSGYHLVQNECVSKAQLAWNVFFGVTGVLAIVVGTWYFNLLWRPSVNDYTLQEALTNRSYSRLRDKASGRLRYPLATNLHKLIESRPPIGGPGLLLHFNFQLIVIIWCVIVILGWLVLAFFVEADLFYVGLEKDDSPEDMCTGIRVGKAYNEGNLEGKLVFAVLLYVVTFIGVILFAIMQRRLFLESDSQSATMMDYAAICRGFPNDAGSSIERDIKRFLAEATGCQIVGISVCWDFRARREDVYNAVADEIQILQGVSQKNADHLGAASPSKGCLRHFFEMVDALLGIGSLPCTGRCCARISCRYVFWSLSTFWGTLPWVRHRVRARGEARTKYDAQTTYIHPDLRPDKCMDDECEHSDSLDVEKEEDAIARESRLAELLASLSSTGEVFAVFASEAERDFAVAALGEPGGPKFRDHCIISAKAVTCEPESIIWHNFGTTWGSKLCSFFFGVIVILISIFFWGAFFYAPYAYYESSYIAAVGEPPGFLPDMSFTLLVVVGNQLVYALCAIVAERLKSPYADTREATYVTLYTTAVLVNIFVDVLIVVYTSYLTMVAADVRTDEGQRLKDLPDAEAIFLSFPMQKTAGKTLYEYNVPSTFVVPFFLEPIFAILLPYHIGVRLVKSRKVSRQEAEDCLAPLPMDLGRYGDILVNAILAILSLFLASGYVLQTFLGLLAGHLFIYAYDHYRVLRQVQDFYFSSDSMESVAQRIAIVPCAMLAAFVAFQMHALKVLGTGSSRVILCCLVAFCVHIALHIFALDYVVPRIGDDPHRQAEAPYDEIAEMFPANWFTVNPVHCLRSRYLHRHRPPCVYYVRGKDHLLESNENIGLHYRPRTVLEEEQELSFPLLTMK